MKRTGCTGKHHPSRGSRKRQRGKTAPCWGWRLGRTERAAGGHFSNSRDRQERNRGCRGRREGNRAPAAGAGTGTEPRSGCSGGTSPAARPGRAPPLRPGAAPRTRRPSPRPRRPHPPGLGGSAPAAPGAVRRCRRCPAPLPPPRRTRRPRLPLQGGAGRARHRQRHRDPRMGPRGPAALPGTHTESPESIPGCGTDGTYLGVLACREGPASDSGAL